MFGCCKGMRLKAAIVLTIIVLYLISTNVNSTSTKKQKVYLFENEKFLTWNDAFVYCKNLNMSLFMVKTKEEFEYLKDIINLKYGRLLPYWLGAYKFEGIYKWLATGEKIRLFMWHEGEPNDKSGHEKCIHTWEGHFDWNDNDCERELPFICEGDGEE